MRKSTSSVLVWLLFGTIALIFVLSFGNPSNSLSLGAQAVARVRGHDIMEAEFRYQYQLARLFLQRGFPEDERMRELMGVNEQVLDAAVERHLAAGLARDLGLDATNTDAENLILDGHVAAFGERRFFMSPEQRFNYDDFVKGWLRTLATPEQRYFDLQREELLAQVLRDTVVGAIAISEGELREAYDQEADQVALDYVRYPASQFSDLVDVDDSEIEAHVAANAEALKNELEGKRAQFSKLPRQVRLRVLELKHRDGAPQDSEMRKIRSALRAGEDFRKLAREHGEGPTARRGGDYGWVSVEGTGSGLPAEVDSTAAALESGAVSDVIRGESSLYLIRVDGTREGDMEDEAAIRLLAEEAVRRVRGQELAKRAAEEVLLAVKSGKTLAEAAAPETDNGGSGEAQLGTTSQSPLRNTGLFSRGARIPGLGESEALTTASFAADAGTTLPQVYVVGGDAIVAAVGERKKPSDEDFAEKRVEIYDRLHERKAGLVLSNWLKRQCLEAKGRGEIVPSAPLVQRLITYATKEEGDTTPDAKRPYSMCDRVGGFPLASLAALQQMMGGGGIPNGAP